MDITTVMNTLLSNETIKGLSKKTGASTEDVKKVLTEALPSMLAGAQKQAKDTNSGFEKALGDHTQNSTANIGTFLKNVDLEDGSKIITHLLGAKANNANIQNVSASTGVNQDTVSQIISAVAPLLLSLLGQQLLGQNISANNTTTAPTSGNLLGSLLGSVDIGQLAMNMLSGSSTTTAETTSTTAASKPAANKKKKPSTSTAKPAAKKKPASDTTKPAAKKKPAAGKKPSTGKTDETKEGSTLDNVVNLLTGLLK